MSAVSRFAAAFGFKPAAANNKEDDEQKSARRAKARERKDGESDEDYAKRCAEEDEKDKAEDDKEKKDATNPAAAAPVAGEAAAVTTARAEGVVAERKRWETVLSDPRAADRGISACHMLAGTDMDATVILSTLATLPAQAGAQESEADGLARRMEAARRANPAPGAGSSGGQDGDNSPAAVAARINAAADKARGVKPAA